MVLVDIHCHILPGVDDGAKDWQTSIKLAREAVADGVTHAVCTPHMLNGKYINHKKDVIRLTENFQDMLDDAKIPLTVFPGQEVRISGDLPKALDDDDILFLDEDGLGGVGPAVKMAKSSIPLSWTTSSRSTSFAVEEITVLNPT